MAKAKTELETFICYGIDEKNRKVYFGKNLLYSEDTMGDFTQTSCEQAIRAIERMAADAPKTPISIYMTSYGGDVYSMLALYDVIHDCSCQIKFYGRGSIMSAASWIMCGADERNLYPNTRIMLHKINSESIGQLTDLEIDLEEMKFLQSKLEEIYEENSRMPASFWKEITKRDLYLSADEAVTLGLADKIIHPKKRGNYRKARQHHLNQKVDARRTNRLVKKLMERVQATPGKLEITLNQPKIEPTDDRLTIEHLNDTVDNLAIEKDLNGKQDT